MNNPLTPLYSLNLEDLEALHAALHTCLYQRAQSSNDPSTDPEWHRLVDLDNAVRDALTLKRQKTPNITRL